MLRAPGPAPDATPGTAGDDGPQVVALSAPTAGRLAATAARLLAWLENAAAGADTPPRLADIARTLREGRVAEEHRWAALCSGTGELRAALAAFTAGRPWPGAAVSVTGPEGPRAPAPAPPSGTPAAAAMAAWLAGDEPDWRPFRAPGARRIPLPVRVFDGDPHPLPGAADPAPGPAREADVTAAEAYLLDRYAEVSGIPADRLHPRVPLERYGLTSYLIGVLNARLAEDFAAPVSRALFFEHRDLAGVAAALAERPDAPWAPRPAGTPGPAPAVRALPRRSAPPAGEPIAIVGMAGRYPQAPDLATFWRQLERGYDAITPLPESRRRPGWPVDLMWGAFLDDVDRFDARFFRISPRDAALMDPQERLFLEVAWETLEDAGYSPERLRERHGGGRVGVYAGAMYNEYPYLAVERAALGGTPADCGSALAGIANRVSFFLSLCGPSMAVDTMCSASLTALHLAVEALRRGECEAALAGGVNLSLHPHKFRQQDRLGMRSTDHRCRSFGAGGDGFTPGEGVGAVLLKPLGPAERDGDRIHAVILATGVNHGGRTSGYTVPNPVAQGDLVADVLRRAGVDPATVGYLEAHGTGTALGDPVEISGLLRAFGGLPAGSRALGSVKSNIGHAEAAAGIAGLTKAVLQLRHRRLVPSLHAAEPNPGIDWDGTPFTVQREAADWRPGGPGPLRSAVSSFGAGGANAHVVLEEYAPGDGPPSPAGPHLFVLSALDERALAASAARLAAAVTAPGAPPLADVAHTLRTGRREMRERLAVVAADPAGLADALRRFRSGGTEHVVRGSLPGDVPPHGADAPDAAYPGAGGTGGAPASLARHWAGGGRAGWARLAPPGVRRPVSLPSYPFARARHWLPEPEPEPDPAHGPGAVELFTPVWRPAAAPGRADAPPEGPVLCLYADTAPSRAVAGELLAALGPDRVHLLPERDGGDGPGFADAPDPAAVIDGLTARLPGLASWIDVTDLGREGDDAGNGWAARVLMLQRLIASRGGGALRVLHASDPRPGTGAAALPGGARMGGLLPPLGVEYRRLRATVLVPDAAPPDAARQILAEWSAPAGPPGVRYRAGQRLLPALDALDPLPASGTSAAVPVFRADPDRVYVVSGGTRGIGALAASLLAARGARRIALLGTRPLPPRHRWDGLPDDAPEAAAVRTVRELERAGARVMTYGGPLLPGPLTGFLDEVRRRLGPVAGLVHCAGLPSRGRPPFVRKSVDDLRAVAEPKAEGLAALLAACEPDAPDFCVLMSSLSSLAPRLGAGVSDYATANACLDAVADHRPPGGRTRVVAVNWPTWRGTGMGADHADAARPLGLDALGPEDGLRVLETVLALPGGPGSPTRVVPCVPLAGAPFDPSALLATAAPGPDLAPEQGLSLTHI
ncbi:beta-ketoacyl synthase N-terminal-like domain-containing protein [Streptomyces specialis]|uniref:beta-ketoacyl synthase N-terminal-like domain-containing protein n=1 Tax=Streptomyces specialis TaxID=498367 RepID=UPI00073EE365|nr:beta-ketoacyl synthase N-terminal-like domain-containing protein [Streptomyces specialis]